MASFRKVKSGWKAEVARKGVRKARTFPTRQEAKDWAAQAENEVLNSEQIAGSGTFGELLDRYGREVSTHKKGARWEIIRIEKIKRDKLAAIQLRNLKPADFGEWRDRQDLAPASIIREMQLMSAALNEARKEWGIISTNPLSDVRRPKKPQPRDRLPTEEDFDRLAHSAGEDLTKATARAYHAFLFACETAMRAGEITGLVWDRVDLERRVAKLTHTKNGRPRDVPLSSEAIRLLEALPQFDPVFGLNSRQLDALWRKLRDRAKVEGLTFHDSRHFAVTRLSKKLDVLELAKMVGHTDLRILLNVYYQSDASEVAGKLD